MVIHSYKWWYNSLNGAIADLKLVKGHDCTNRKGEIEQLGTPKGLKASFAPLNYRIAASHVRQSCPLCLQRVGKCPVSVLRISDITFRYLVEITSELGGVKKVPTFASPIIIRDTQSSTSAFSSPRFPLKPSAHTVQLKDMLF